MISNCLKLLVSVCLTMALSGCQQPITRQEMVGTYTYMGKTNGGMIVLKQNGTFADGYKAGTKETLSDEGQWRMYVDDKIIMDDTRLSLTYSREARVWDTLVERDGEDILIIADIDAAEFYKKMRR